MTCSSLGGGACGAADDGCGETLDCGTCAAPKTCGGGGTANQCGTPCVPTTCATMGYACGHIWDGCQATLDCGTCPEGEACGVAGVAGQCSSCLSSCVPWTCAEQGIAIGPVSDGCGDVLQCAQCHCEYDPGCVNAITDPPGAWFIPMCCGSVIERSTCGSLGLGCGRGVDPWYHDVIDCGPCLRDGTCPGLGKAGDCSPCTPRTCAEQGFDCGPQSDRCGGEIDCGTCDDCIQCNGGRCGGRLISLCAPKTCAELGVECGAAPDGCGGAVGCGACPSGLTCARGICLPVCM